MDSAYLWMDSNTKHNVLPYSLGTKEEQDSKPRVLLQKPRRAQSRITTAHEASTSHPLAPVPFKEEHKCDHWKHDASTQSSPPARVPANT
jgi:hypothetical protein